MKNLLIMAILVSFFSTSVFAEGQTNTECPMISQARENAKLLKDKVKKIRTNKNKGRAI